MPNRGRYIAAAALLALAAPSAQAQAVREQNRSPLATLSQQSPPVLAKVATDAIEGLSCATVAPSNKGCILAIAGVSHDGSRVALYLHGVDDSDYAVFSTANLVEQARLRKLDAPGTTITFLDDPDRILLMPGAGVVPAVWNRNDGRVIEAEKSLGRLHAYRAPHLLFAEGGGAGEYCELNVYGGDFRLLSTYSDARKKLDACGIYAMNASDDGAIIAANFVDDQSAEEADQRQSIAAIRWKSGISLIEVPGTMGAISPDGTRLMTWNQPTRMAEVYDVATRRKLFALSTGKAMVTGIAWAHNGAMIATTDSDGAINLWDAANGSHLSRFGALEGRACELTYEPAGKLRFTRGGRGIIAECDDQMRLFDVATGTLVRAFDANDVVLAEVSADGSTIVEARTGTGGSAQVTVWRIEG